MYVKLFRLEYFLRKRHLGSALRIQKLNSRLSHLNRSKANPKTRVFISMCTFNGASWVKNAIDSVLNQSHTNWFLRVVDDGSSDSTKQILLQYQEKFPGQILVLALNENSFPKSPTNLNLEHFLVKNEFDVFTILDQDDVADTAWLQIGLELLTAKVKCVRCRNARYNGDLTEHLYEYPAASQLFLAREVVKRVGVRVNRYSTIAGDTEYLMRVEQDAIDHNYAVILTKPICQKMRVHGANMSMQKKRKE